MDETLTRKGRNSSGASLKNVILRRAYRLMTAQSMNGIPLASRNFISLKANVSLFKI